MVYDCIGDAVWDILADSEIWGEAEAVLDAESDVDTDTLNEGVWEILCDSVVVTTSVRDGVRLTDTDGLGEKENFPV